MSVINRIKNAFLKQNRTRMAIAGCLFSAFIMFAARGCYIYLFFNEPLLWAAQDGNLPELKRLVNAGADLNCIWKNGDTALQFAVDSGQYDAAALLLKLGANPNNENLEGRTALDMASTAKMANILNAYGAKHGSHPNGITH